MKTFTFAEVEAQFEELANNVIETGEHIRLVLENGQSMVMMPRTEYERWTTPRTQESQAEE